jgi:SAM-dependent methyltransferase
VLDIGGATGIHARPLAAAGHRVTLVDPVEEQIVKARRHGTFHAEVGDARQLRFANNSFEVALLLGPLYHLQSAADRLKAQPASPTSNSTPSKAPPALVRRTAHLRLTRDQSNQLMAIGRV